MSDINAETVLSAGFKVDAAGKVRTDNGRLVKADVAGAINDGKIIANFDPASLRKAKARKAVTGGKNLIELLNEISPEIGMLAVGMTAKLPMPQKKPGDEKDPKRSFVMSIVTKLNNITQEGREWAGRQFDCLSDEDGVFFYVTRIEDTDTPHKRKPGGGRVKGSTNSSKSTLATALERAKQHLGPDANKDDAEAQLTAKVAAEGEEVIIGGEAGGTPKTEVTDEAQVITH